MLPGWLEVNLAAELQDARIEGRVELAEVGVSNGIVGSIELGMVPSVEGLDTQFETAAARFVEHEALEQREVPVVAARAGQAVVYEGSPRTRSGISKGCWVEVLDSLAASKHLVLVADRTDEVRTV